MCVAAADSSSSQANPGAAGDFCRGCLWKRIFAAFRRWYSSSSCNCAVCCWRCSSSSSSLIGHPVLGAPVDVVRVHRSTTLPSLSLTAVFGSRHVGHVILSYASLVCTSLHAQSAQALLPRDGHAHSGSNVANCVTDLRSRQTVHGL